VLEVYALELGRSRDLLGMARYLRSGDFIRNDCVRHYRTRAVHIEGSRPLPINIDGEISGHTPTDFSIRHGAIQVLVPPDAPAIAPGLQGAPDHSSRDGDR